MSDDLEHHRITLSPADLIPGTRVRHKGEVLTVVSVSSRPFLVWDKGAGTVYDIEAVDASGSPRRLGCREWARWEVI